MKSQEGTIDILESVKNEINGLLIQGVLNWQHALNAYGKVNAVVENLKKEEREKQREHDIEIQKMKIQREQQLKEAVERGETVIGGETIRINADGSKEVIIP